MFLTSLFVMQAIVLQAGPQEASPPQRSISALIEDLGARNFTVRQDATRELKARGRAAITGLQTAATSDQQEVRARAKSILGFILGTTARKRFLAEATPVNASQVVGWKRLRVMCASDNEAIGTLKTWLAAEPALFESQVIGGRAFSTELKQRVDRLSDFLQDTKPGHKREQVALQSAQAILFLVTDPTLKPTSKTMSACESLFELGPTARALATKDRLTRALAGKWIESDASQYHKLLLTLRFGLPEGLPLAESIVKSRARGRRMEYALHCIGKLGGEKQVALLETQLQNKVRLSRRGSRAVVGLGGQRDPSDYEYQVRDVALAMLWHLHKQSPQKHGFSTRVRNSGLFVFAPGTLGFDSEEQRTAALKEWERYSAAL